MSAGSAVEGLLHALEESVRAEQMAKARLRLTTERVAQLVRRLQSVGLKSFVIAGRVARTLGLSPTVETQRRIASRLRQRASRVTRRRGIVSGAHGEAEVAAKAEPKLIRRVVTTEYEVDPEEDLEHEEELEDPEDDEDVDPEDEKSRPRRRKR